MFNALEDNNPLLAMRYALAGYQESPNNRTELKLLLAKALDRLGQHKLFYGHEQYVTSIGFSPDGTKIVSSSTDHTIRLWDVKTGKQIGAALTGHESGVESVGFSPDGTKIVSGSFDGTVLLWDVKTGKQIGVLLVGHDDGVSSVGFSPDGTKIVTGGEGGSVRLWDVKTGKQIGALHVGNDEGVTSVGFSPDGSMIVSGSGRGDDTVIRLWDVKTLNQRSASLNDPEDEDKTPDDKLYNKNWDEMADQACNRILGAPGSRFTQDEKYADPLLFSQWYYEKQDVCVTPTPLEKLDLWLNRIPLWVYFFGTLEKEIDI